MKIRNVAIAVAAISMAAAPAIAQASFERSTAPVEGESGAAGTSGILIALFAAAAAIAGIVIIADGGNDEPASP